MNINRFNLKILIIIIISYIITMFSIILLSNYYLKGIIDYKTGMIYYEKIDTIIESLNRKYERLRNTFLIEVYEHEFKDSFISDFRKSYYSARDPVAKPFILDNSGKFIAFPKNKNIYVSNISNQLIKQIIKTKIGSFDYEANNQKIWVVFEYFKEWGWIVGYFIPHEEKYSGFNNYKKFMLIIRFSINIVSLIIVSLVITAYTKPVYTLTNASRALSSGNLDYPLEIKSKDELGILTESFILMRDSISKTINDLNIKNSELTSEIAQREKISNALTESEKRYRLLIENQNDLIIKFDPDKRILFVSPSYCRLFAKSEEELTGNSFMSLIYEKDRELVDQSINRVFTYPHKYYHEERAITVDGCKWFAWSGKGVPDSSGNIKEIIAVGRDITEKKNDEIEREKLIASLEEKNSEMERFVYTISHDLKAPLNNIKGFLGILKREVAQENYKDISSFIDRMLKCADKMSDIFDDLLNLSRVGCVVNKPELFSFDELAHEVIEFFSNKIDEKKIKIVIDENVPEIYGEKHRIFEVLMNLVQNAIKYSGLNPETRIRIGNIPSENETIIFVEDNGIGIEKEYIDKIFGLFSKLNPNSEGTGVGLALVKRIIECHKGKIWVESMGAGKGSTFYFSLPKKKDV